MYIQGLKIRYINYACYEIVLPNGKVLVVDPCIELGYKIPGVIEREPLDFKHDDFTGADYILLSHTHADHTMEVGYLAKKFHLFITGGSDFHGSNKPSIHLGTGLGTLFVPWELLNNIQSMVLT